ncbi:YtxH domain-containing protein [Corallococcus sp. CA047B]|uniref:YtxH domain-containing protein n=1 Tax=Corallococcus sp. CA047B TaxID=2316729 RepID=UPI000EA0E511|nr:YtxH domain-containing protein [Corallococcus sp. CA047B]RKH20207.1 YtxH domain-containing protein [Corallococcus sp. CA047B]
MKKLTLLAVTLGSLVVGAGCHRNTRDEAKDDVEEAGDKVKDTAEDAADATGDTAEKAGDKIEDATDK